MKRTDHCPGVLRPHQAADGAMVRVRLPGGQTTGIGLVRLASLARRHGSGLLQLTSRASVQVRGLPTPVPTAVADELAAAGFLPSRTHERVRNIVASPLTGLSPAPGSGRAVDLRPMIAALDHALLAEPGLATLPGRFLFALDDGRGDVTGLGADLAYRALDATSGTVLIGGTDRGFPIDATAAVHALVEIALGFQEARTESAAWHVRELPGFAARYPRTDPGWPAPGGSPVALGAVGGHASVAVPMGLLDPAQMDLVAALAGERPVVVTPWRGLVIADAADRLDELVAAGLVAVADSFWTAVTACVGSPWCAKSGVDTRQLLGAAAALPATWPRTHVSGCERRCGAPAGEHRDLVAPDRKDLLALAGTRA